MRPGLLFQVDDNAEDVVESTGNWSAPPGLKFRSGPLLFFKTENEYRNDLPRQSGQQPPRRRSI